MPVKTRRGRKNCRLLRRWHKSQRRKGSSLKRQLVCQVSRSRKNAAQRRKESKLKRKKLRDSSRNRWRSHNRNHPLQQTSKTFPHRQTWTTFKRAESPLTSTMTKVTQTPQARTWPPSKAVPLPTKEKATSTSFRQTSSTLRFFSSLTPTVKARSRLSSCRCAPKPWAGATPNVSPIELLTHASRGADGANGHKRWVCLGRRVRFNHEVHPAEEACLHASTNHR